MIQTQVRSFEDYLIGRSERTIQAYCQDVRSFVNWWERNYGEGFVAERLISKDFRDYRKSSIEGEQVKPATWNRRLASLAVWCQWLGRADLIADIDPMDEVELPPRWLDEVEYRKFMRELEIRVNGARSDVKKRDAVRDLAMVGLMVWGGLREGEVCALEVKDVELGERSGKVVVRLGKGGKRREVPLNSEGRRAIDKWLEVRGSGSGLLFDGLVTRTVQRRVAEVGRLAGLVVTPHDLRHTFAKRMVNRNVPITTISKLLGHSRLEVTARYVQPGWNDYEIAVEGIG